MRTLNNNYKKSLSEKAAFFNHSDRANTMLGINDLIIKYLEIIGEHKQVYSVGD